MIALPDGRLVLMGYGLVTRLLPDGSLDPGFDGDGTIDPGLTGFDGKPVLASPSALPFRWPPPTCRAPISGRHGRSAR